MPTHYTPCAHCGKPKTVLIPVVMQLSTAESSGSPLPVPPATHIELWCPQCLIQR